MAGRFSVETVFKAIDKISAPISRMQNRVGKFTRKMNRSFQSLNRKVNKFGGSVKRASLIATASLAIAGAAGADVVDTFAQFEQSVVNAAAKFPGAIKRGTDQFKLLENAARKVGSQTEFTASQAAEGLNFLAMAGFNAQQSVSALPGLVDLATAAQIDLAMASDIATDTLGAFGLTSKDAATNAANLARVSDVLAATTTSANTDMVQLFETIKSSGAVVTGAGGSIETFAALAGKLANSGLKASEAGNSMKNIFIRLSAPAAGAAKQLKKLGVETKDSQGNLRDMIDIFGDLDKGLEGIGTADRAAVLKEIFGIRAITGANLLLKEGASSLKKYRIQLENAEGSSKDMAKTMRDTMLGRFKSLGSAIESVKISLTKLQGGGIEKVTDGITDWVRKIDAGINANQELAGGALMDVFNIIVESTKVLGMFIAAFIAMKFVILTVQTGVIAFNTVLLLWKGTMLILTGVMGAFKLVMAAVNIVMLANPIGLIIAGVVALIAIGTLLVKNWGNIGDFFTDLWGGIVSAFESSIGFIKGVIDTILNPLSALKKLFSSLGAKVGILLEAEVKADEVNKKTKPPESSTGVKILPFKNNKKENDQSDRPSAKPIVISPQERIARSIEEKRETSTVDINVNDNTGRADVSAKGPVNNGGLKIARSGAF